MSDINIYVVQQGYYEQAENVLVTTNLETAILMYLTDTSSVIEIWKDEVNIHSYGIFQFESNKKHSEICFDIKFIESNGYDEYIAKRRKQYRIQ